MSPALAGPCKSLLSYQETRNETGELQGGDGQEIRMPDRFLTLEHLPQAKGWGRAAAAR